LALTVDWKLSYAMKFGLLPTIGEISGLAALWEILTPASFGIAEIESRHAKERQAIGLTLAKQRGIYKGRKSGTTKAAPARARTLKKQGLTVPGIAMAPR
jgi:hypothetical protein